MIYTTCIMCYATFAYRRSTGYGVALGLFLFSLAAFITIYYHFLQDPTFHQNAYALLTAVVVFRSMYVMERNIRPEWESKERALKQGVQTNGSANGALNAEEKAEQRRRDERDVKILKTMWTMVAYGLSSFLGGFAIWGLDRVFCSAFRHARREIGLPWGILLEGHGWW
jgi:dihydroceramidase